MYMVRSQNSTALIVRRTEIKKYMYAVRKGVTLSIWVIFAAATWGYRLTSKLSKQLLQLQWTRQFRVIDSSGSPLDKTYLFFPEWQSI